MNSEEHTKKAVQEVKKQISGILGRTQLSFDAALGVAILFAKNLMGPDVASRVNWQRVEQILKRNENSLKAPNTFRNKTRAGGKRKTRKNTRRRHINRKRD